jgi:DNA-directed RNA polymerase
MTSVYGVTYVGARQQIQEKIEEKVRYMYTKINILCTGELTQACFILSWRSKGMILMR